MLLKAVDNQIIFTNKARCRDCYRCFRNCPVNAIKMKDGQASVEVELCILCGACLQVCPQNAKQYRRDIEKVKRLIKENENVAVSIAPSFPALFEDWQIERVPSLMRKLGFSCVCETAEAAYYVAKETKKFFSEKEKGLCLSTACPSFVTYVEKYQTKNVDNLMPIVSPMIAHAKRLKKKLGSHWKVVFIGPCVAKKAEAERAEYKGLIDGVLTFTELLEWMEEEKIDLKQYEASEFDEQAASDARLYALTGGMSKTAALETDNLNRSVYALSGYTDIVDSINSFNDTNNKIMIEPLICSIGCVNGSGLPKAKNVYKRKENVINYAKQKSNFEAVIDECMVKLTTTFNHAAGLLEEEYSEGQIRNVLEQTGKQNEEDQLNCAACGYSTCLENAKAILRGMVEIESCIPYMRRLAEQRTDKIIETSPNGIVILNKELEIIHMNPAFKKFFMCTNSVIGKRISYLMDPEAFIKLKESDTAAIEQTVNHTNYNIVCHQILYKLKEDSQYIGFFVDITKNLSDEEKLDYLRERTILQAQELLEHQVEMAQQLAKLLGGNTAKVEELVENLIKLTQDEKVKNIGRNKNGLWDTYTTK
ncbi:MAG: [Fe-Fe] hydrogenase large subunit C-terminal domain-containing protein [Bacteroidota bacterium]